MSGVESNIRSSQSPAHKRPVPGSSAGPFRHRPSSPRAMTRSPPRKIQPSGVVTSSTITRLPEHSNIDSAPL